MKKHLTIAAIFVGSAVLTAFLIELIHNPGAYIATLTHPLGQYRLASNKLETDRIQARNELWMLRLEKDNIDQSYRLPREPDLFDDEAYKEYMKELDNIPENNPFNSKYNLRSINRVKPEL